MRNPSDDDFDPTLKPTRRRAPSGANNDERLQALQARKNRLDAQITAIESRVKARERRDRTRSFILIGAAVSADMELYPETLTYLRTILERSTVLLERDRAFLKARGLID